jgi:maternal embryonic leucine zipper kinase
VTPQKVTYTCLEPSVDKSQVPKVPKEESPSVQNKMRQLFGKSPGTNNCPTPQKTPAKAVMSTPLRKAGIFQRLLASATPSLADKPRLITAQNVAKNITLTTFTEAAECIKSLVSSLESKGYLCKAKKYLVHVEKKNKYNGSVIISFDLEIVQFEGHVAIQRKRLKGDSWFYKKICEEILRVSNENAMEAVV